MFMSGNLVTFKDYAAWTIQDLAALTKEAKTQDEDLVSLPLFTADPKVKTGEAQILKLDKNISAEEKRNRIREAVLPRLRDIYGQNLGIMANATGGMTPVVDNFFKGLDEFFRADTQKPKEDTLVNYLERKILEPIEELRKSFSDESSLTRAKYVFDLVKEKINTGK